MSKYSLFYPKSKREIVYDYPELLKYEEFKKLDGSEIVFVWYHSCKASPFYHMDDEEGRINDCLKRAFPNEGEREAHKNRFFGGFEEKIRDACYRMESFEPAARMRMKKMTEKMFENVEDVLKIDKENVNEEFMDKDGNVDWQKKKAYLDSVAKANETFPRMLKNLENQFGIVEDEEDEEDEFIYGDAMEEAIERHG